MNILIITIVVLIILSALFKLITLLNNHLSLRKKLSPIPGPKSLPLIGLYFDMKDVPSNDIFGRLEELFFKFKNGMVLVWMGTVPVIHIRKPHQLEIIMKSQTLISKSPFLYNFLFDWLGNGLITSTGDLWHRQRRLVTPAFHANVLDQFSDIIFEKVSILNSIIQRQSYENPNGSVNVYPLAIRFTLDTACETVMGVNMDIQMKPKNEYNTALSRFTELSTHRFTHFWLLNDFIFNLTKKGKEYYQCIKTMHDFTTKVINDKKARRANKNMNQIDQKVDEDEVYIGKRKNKAFLDLLMDLSEADENSPSPEEFREQVETFMFGAHDTSGIAISYALFCLGSHPEIQKKVHEEIDEVLGDKEKPDKHQLKKLHLLERVIKETLRLFPSGPFISRCTDHEVTIDGCVIPKGITINMDILYCHRDPEVWEDPLKFDPDRFLPENSERRHPYAYVPFSSGLRSCIGQKYAQLVLKIALCSILKKWTVTSELKIDEMKLIPEIVLKPPEETINLHFQSRSNQ